MQHPDPLAALAATRADLGIRSAPLRTRLVFAGSFLAAAFALLAGLGFVILSLCSVYAPSIPPHLTLLLVSLGTILGFVSAGVLILAKSAAIRLAIHLG